MVVRLLERAICGQTFSPPAPDHRTSATQGDESWVNCTRKWPPVSSSIPLFEAHPEGYLYCAKSSASYCGRSPAEMGQQGNPRAPPRAPGRWILALTLRRPSMSAVRKWSASEMRSAAGCAGSTNRRRRSGAGRRTWVYCPLASTAVRPPASKAVFPSDHVGILGSSGPGVERKSSW
jgi:hypothetical protein